MLNEEIDMRAKHLYEIERLIAEYNIIEKQVPRKKASRY